MDADEVTWANSGLPISDCERLFTMLGLWGLCPQAPGIFRFGPMA